MDGPLVTATCVLRNGEDGLTVGLCDSGTPPLPGDGGDLDFVSFCWWWFPEFRSSLSPADIDCYQVLGPQPYKGKPAG